MNEHVLLSDLCFGMDHGVSDLGFPSGLGCIGVQCSEYSRNIEAKRCV